MRDLAAGGIPIAKSLQVLGFSRQAFYEWESDPVSDRDWVDAHLTNAAIEVHREDPEFGYRFVSDELRAAGWAVSEKRIWRLCSQAGLFSFHAKRRGKGRRPGPPVHDDLVQRQFGASTPNQLWFTDITEHPTREGKLYLCAVKDAFSNMVVWYSMGDRMTSHLAVATLQDAIGRRGPVKGCVVHSDRGSQFRSRRFAEALKWHGLVGSMGRVASAGDNAAMESFFALLQKNLLNRHIWATRDQLRGAITLWIERNYHRKRRQRALGRLTPIEFEMIHKTAAKAACNSEVNLSGQSTAVPFDPDPGHGKCSGFGRGILRDVGPGENLRRSPEWLRRLGVPPARSAQRGELGGVDPDPGHARESHASAGLLCVIGQVRTCGGRRPVAHRVRKPSHARRRSGMINTTTESGKSGQVKPSGSQPEPAETHARP